MFDNWNDFLFRRIPLRAVSGLENRSRSGSRIGERPFDHSRIAFVDSNPIGRYVERLVKRILQAATQLIGCRATKASRGIAPLRIILARCRPTASRFYFSSQRFKLEYMKPE
jgi:hypothetical protein